MSLHFVLAASNKVLSSLLWEQCIRVERKHSFRGTNRCWKAWKRAMKTVYLSVCEIIGSTVPNATREFLYEDPTRLFFIAHTKHSSEKVSVLNVHFSHLDETQKGLNMRCCFKRRKQTRSSAGTEMGFPPFIYSMLNKVNVRVVSVRMSCVCVLFCSENISDCLSDCAKTQFINTSCQSDTFCGKITCSWWGQVLGWERKCVLVSKFQTGLGSALHASVQVWCLSPGLLTRTHTHALTHTHTHIQHRCAHLQNNQKL